MSQLQNVAPSGLRRAQEAAALQRAEVAFFRSARNTRWAPVCGDCGNTEQSPSNGGDRGKLLMTRV